MDNVDGSSSYSSLYSSLFRERNSTATVDLSNSTKRRSKFPDLRSANPPTMTVNAKKCLNHHLVRRPTSTIGCCHSSPSSNSSILRIKSYIDRRTHQQQSNHVQKHGHTEPDSVPRQELRSSVGLTPIFKFTANNHRTTSVSRQQHHHHHHHQQHRQHRQHHQHHQQHSNSVRNSKNYQNSLNTNSSELSNSELLQMTLSIKRTYQHRMDNSPTQSSFYQPESDLDRLNCDRQGLTSIPQFKDTNIVQQLRLLSLQHNLIDRFHVPKSLGEEDDDGGDGSSLEKDLTQNKDESDSITSDVKNVKKVKCTPLPLLSTHSMSSSNGTETQRRTTFMNHLQSNVMGPKKVQQSLKSLSETNNSNHTNENMCQRKTTRTNANRSSNTNKTNHTTTTTITTSTKIINSNSSMPTTTTATTATTTNGFSKVKRKSNDGHHHHRQQRLYGNRSAIVKTGVQLESSNNSGLSGTITVNDSNYYSLCSVEETGSSNTNPNYNSNTDLNVNDFVVRESNEGQLKELQDNQNRNHLNSIKNTGNTFINLVFLDLYDNQIETISNLDGLPSLTVLLLGKNRIKTISGLHSLRDTLRVLDLHDNRITHLTNENDLHYLHELRSLNLSSNYLQEIQSNALNGLQKLNELNLKRNRLITIQGFEYLNALERLWLCHNEIRSIERIPSIIELRNLIEISIDHNPISMNDDLYTYLISYLPNLQRLSRLYITDSARKAAIHWHQNRQQYSLQTLANRTKQIQTTNDEGNESKTAQESIETNSSSQQLMVSNGNSADTLDNQATQATQATLDTHVTLATSGISSAATLRSCNRKTIHKKRIIRNAFCHKSTQSIVNKSIQSVNVNSVASNCSSEEEQGQEQTQRDRELPSKKQNPEKTIPPPTSNITLNAQNGRRRSTMTSNVFENGMTTTENVGPSKWPNKLNSQILMMPATIRTVSFPNDAIMGGARQNLCRNEFRPFSKSFVSMMASATASMVANGPTVTGATITTTTTTTTTTLTVTTMKAFNGSHHREARILAENIGKMIYTMAGHKLCCKITESPVTQSSFCNIIKYPTEIHRQSMSVTACCTGTYNNNNNNNSGYKTKLMNTVVTPVPKGGTTAVNQTNGSIQITAITAISSVQPQVTTSTTFNGNTQTMTASTTAHETKSTIDEVKIGASLTAVNTERRTMPFSENSEKEGHSTVDRVTHKEDIVETMNGKESTANNNVSATVTTSTNQKRDVAVYPLEKENFIEVIGQDLNINGQNALKFLDKPWNNNNNSSNLNYNSKTINDVHTINFNSIDFNSIITYLNRLKLRFPQLENYVFRNTNLTYLGQLNALAELQGITSILVHNEGNIITTKTIWTSYAIYRLAHWGLKSVNNMEVTMESIDAANKMFLGLTKFVLWAIPDQTIMTLLTRLNLEETISDHRDQLTPKQCLLKAGNELVLLIVVKEALQWTRPYTVNNNPNSQRVDGGNSTLNENHNVLENSSHSENLSDSMSQNFKSSSTSYGLNGTTTTTTTTGSASATTTFASSSTHSEGIQERGRLKLNQMLENACNVLEKLNILQTLWPSVLSDIVRNALIDYSQMHTYIRNLMTELMC